MTLLGNARNHVTSNVVVTLWVLTSFLRSLFLNLHEHKGREELNSEEGLFQSVGRHIEEITRNFSVLLGGQTRMRVAEFKLSLS